MNSTQMMLQQMTQRWYRINSRRPVAGGGPSASKPQEEIPRGLSLADWAAIALVLAVVCLPVLVAALFLPLGK